MEISREASRNFPWAAN